MQKGRRVGTLPIDAEPLDKGLNIVHPSSRDPRAVYGAGAPSFNACPPSGFTDRN
jgi:hypothetical protein